MKKIIVLLFVLTAGLNAFAKNYSCVGQLEILNQDTVKEKFEFSFDVEMEKSCFGSEGCWDVANISNLIHGFEKIEKPFANVTTLSTTVKNWNGYDLAVFSIQISNQDENWFSTWGKLELKQGSESWENIHGNLFDMKNLKKLKLETRSYDSVNADAQAQLVPKTSVTCQ